MKVTPVHDAAERIIESVRSNPVEMGGTLYRAKIGGRDRLEVGSV